MNDSGRQSPRRCRPPALLGLNCPTGVFAAGAVSSAAAGALALYSFPGPCSVWSPGPSHALSILPRCAKSAATVLLATLPLPTIYEKTSAIVSGRPSAQRGSLQFGMQVLKAFGQICSFVKCMHVFNASKAPHRCSAAFQPAAAVSSKGLIPAPVAHTNAHLQPVHCLSRAGRAPKPACTIFVPPCRNIIFLVQYAYFKRYFESVRAVAVPMTPAPITATSYIYKPAGVTLPSLKK